MYFQRLFVPLEAMFLVPAFTMMKEVYVGQLNAALNPSTIVAIMTASFPSSLPIIKVAVEKFRHRKEEVTTGEISRTKGGRRIQLAEWRRGYCLRGKNMKRPERKDSPKNGLNAKKKNSKSFNTLHSIPLHYK